MNFKTLAMILAAGALVFAQGPRGPQNNNAPRGTGAGLDMTKVQIVEGTVAAVHIGYGLQYPSIQIGQTAIKIAPVWFLLENDFEIKVGDSLKVTAAPSLDPKDSYLAALSMTNLASNATLALRDPNGLPLWLNSRGAESPGPRMGCALTQITTVADTVDQVTAGAGVQMPSLVLKTADGKLLTVKIGPERILLAADFEIKPGDALTVKYGVNCVGENVALELTNAAGRTVVLR